MTDYDKNKEPSYIQYCNGNHLYGWTTSQKLPVNNSAWKKDISQFYKDLIKNYNDKSDEGYFLEGDVQRLEKLPELYSDLPFLLERLKTEKA